MNKEKKQLQLDLQKIAKNEYNLAEGKKACDYTSLMLQYIGDPDSELRDDLIYTTFYQWICKKEYFSEDELRNILSILMDENHLFYHIGSDSDDTVFTRSFSILVVVLILFHHKEKSFLDYDMIIKTKNNILKYYKEEQDFRGYIDVKGWAHGAAHGADALDELVELKECGKAVHTEILDAIESVLFNGKYIFSHEEDERIANVILNIMEKKLIDYESIKNWFKELTKCCNSKWSYNQYVSRVNSKNLVRCVYFRLLNTEGTLEIIDTLRKIEKQLNRFVD